MIGSQTIWYDIQSLGGTPAKSLTAAWLYPPTHFLADFVRGYIDGDGTIQWGLRGQSRVPDITVYGTCDFLTGMASAVEGATGIPAPICRKYNRTYGDKVAFVRWSGLPSKVLAVWLYHDCNLYMERKQATALSFLNWMPKRFGFKRHTVTPRMRELFGAYLP